MKHYLSTYQQNANTDVGSLMENGSADDLQEQENSTDDGSSSSSARTTESPHKKPSLLYENKGCENGTTTKC
jgi:hypothetical protein